MNLYLSASNYIEYKDVKTLAIDLTKMGHNVDYHKRGSVYDPSKVSRADVVIVLTEYGWMAKGACTEVRKALKERKSVFNYHCVVDDYLKPDDYVHEVTGVEINDSEPWSSKMYAEVLLEYEKRSFKELFLSNSSTKYDPETFEPVSNKLLLLCAM